MSAALSHRRPVSPAARAAATIAILYVGVAASAGWRLATLAPPPASTTQFQFRINPNVADRAELQLLPGIGPKLAEAIVAYRAQVPAPAFRSADDLARVKRIGPVTVARLRPLLECVAGAP